MRYVDHLRATHGLIDQQITDLLTLRDGQLWFRDLNLMQLIAEHGTPLEVSYLPVITDRVRTMIDLFERARQDTGYRGQFVYAYASKANVNEEVVTTALAAGAHYESSSAFDLDIVRLLRGRSLLRDDRLVICNGYKLAAYAAKILQLRAEGLTGIMPVLDNPGELPQFQRAEGPLLMGVRQRIESGVASIDDLDRVDSRFGMDFQRLSELCEQIDTSPNLELALYHTMFGSQLEDEVQFLASLRFAAECYARLKQRHPSLRYLDFGGGVPVAYRIGFHFDYAGFARRLLETIREVCTAHGVEEPAIIGEFGRYTAAEHGFHLFEIVVEKPTSRPGASWYLIDGSLMVALPDIWALGQEFIVLPINGYDRECHSVWFGGLTCDSDDEYRGPKDTGDFFTMPRMLPGEPLYIGFFATGAYQEMLSGVRGAHHCLMPEAKELIIEHVGEAEHAVRSWPEQTSEEILDMLGYGRHSLDPPADIG